MMTGGPGSMAAMLASSPQITCSLTNDGFSLVGRLGSMRFFTRAR